ncbi:hypothetical protein D3C78_1828650 [compost metagenome]
MHIEHNSVVVADVQSAVTAHEAKRLMLKALLGQSFQVAHLVGVHQCFSRFRPAPSQESHFSLS